MVPSEQLEEGLRLATLANPVTEENGRRAVTEDSEADTKVIDTPILFARHTPASTTLPRLLPLLRRAKDLQS